MSNLSKLEIITVNYNASEKTEQFLNSLALSGCNSKVIVVDNSTVQDEKKKLQKVLDHTVYKGEIELITSSHNVGYFGAISSVVGRISDEAEWCIVCNNDLIFEKSAYTEICNRTADCSKEILCIAPYVKDEKTNTALNPFLRERPNARLIWMLRLQFSSYVMFVFMNFANLIRKRFAWIRFLPRQKSTSSLGEHGIPIYAGHGSIFILRRKLLADGVDFGYFLYGEEISIAEKVLKFGGLISFEPRIKIVHQSHSSTGSIWSRKTFKRKQRAINYILERYF